VTSLPLSLLKYALKLSIFSDDLTADVDPELILQELGDGDVNCTVANAVGQVEYRWTRLSHPEWDHVYTQVLEFSQVILHNCIPDVGSELSSL